MQIINERLGGAGDVATSDGTIGTISCMVKYEANSGTVESVGTHVGVLGVMVRLRGE